MMAYNRGGSLRTTVLKNDQGQPIARAEHSYDIKGRRFRSHTTGTGENGTLSDLRWEYDTRDRM